MNHEPTDLDQLAIPPFPSRVVRRAVWRGVARTTLAVLTSLTMLALVLLGATAVGEHLRGERFYRVVFQGSVVAHPEYLLAQDGSCCTAGPLLGVPHLGLAQSVTFRATPIGSLHYPPASRLTVTQDVSGKVHTDIGWQSTPLAAALQRGRPSKSSTASFLSGLPEATIASAVVEFAQPLDSTAYESFLSSLWSSEALPGLAGHGPILLVDVYQSSMHNPISWPHPAMSEFRTWAHSLGPDDDRLLDAIGLPPAKTIQATADEGRVYAFVVDRMTTSALTKLIANSAIRSINVIDVAFDVDRQVLQ